MHMAAPVLHHYWSKKMCRQFKVNRKWNIFVKAKVHIFCKDIAGEQNKIHVLEMER